MQKTDGIRIPGIILDELKTLDYSQDERFSNADDKKRKRGNGKHMSRKEKRKIQRAEKKQKSNPARERNPTHSRSTPRLQERGVNSVKKDVVKQVNSKHSTSSEMSEDADEQGFTGEELGDDDYDEAFGDDDFDEKLEMDGEQTMSVEDTMKELELLKQKKTNGKGVEKFGKHEGKSKDKRHIQSEDTSEDFISYPLAPSDRAAFERDEMDMQYLSLIHI